MKRKPLTIVPPRERQHEEDTPERFQRLTGHLRVNGKVLESVLFKLAAEKEAQR